MIMTKYRITGTNRVGILTNTYGKNLEFIIKCTNELKRDYPQLKDSEVDIMSLAGSRHARQLSFEANVGNVKDEYKAYPFEWLTTF